MSEIRYRPAAGVASDFERLLKKFICSSSVRYEDFAKIWKEMRMSYIYAGRDLEKELREFIEECLAIALKLFLPPYEFEMRVGGLYLLYALYHTQPFSPKVKVRVTLQQWLDMQDFHAIVKSQQHYDISFILVRLRLDKAFLFVASPTELHPSAAEREVEVPPFDVGKPLEIVSAEVAEQVYAVHDQYSKMKRALAGSESEQPDASLDVTQGDLTTAMMDIVKKYEGIAENRLIAQTNDTEILSTGAKGSNGRSARTRRANAKSRNFSKKELPHDGAMDAEQESGCTIKVTKSKRGSAPEPTRGRCRGRGGSAVRRRVSHDVDTSSDGSDSTAEAPLAHLIDSSQPAKVRRQRGRPRASANNPSSPAAVKPQRKKQRSSRRKRAASSDSDGDDAYSVHDTSEDTDCSNEVVKHRAKNRRVATAARLPASCEHQAPKVDRPSHSQLLENTGDETASRVAATHAAVDSSSSCSDVEDGSGATSPAAGDQPQFLDMPELV